jgi:hypothetical protein
MAIHFRTETPNKLLAAYKKAIDDGHVDTWSYDKDGDFTHTVEQWKYKAWLRPSVRAGEFLDFFIVKPKETKITTATYSIYHGRFIESMLAHCDKLFTDAFASAMPEDKDLV